MNGKSNASLFLPKPLSRQLAIRISALEGLHMSSEMKAMFAEFDAQKLTGAERRVQLLARYENA